MADAGGVAVDHTMKVGETAEIHVDGHPERTDSPEFLHAKEAAHKIIATLGTGVFQGAGDYQMHHGGSLWLNDGKGWFLVLNEAGIEWSSQFCIMENVRILTDDLRWMPAGDLVPGERLLAFDEEPLPKRWRFWRPSTVLSVDRIKAPCYELLFDDDTTVRCSADHRWLASYGDADLTQPKRTSRWLETRRLRPGGGPWSSKVVKPIEPWYEEQSRALGYLAAAFDGEGHLQQSITGPRTGARGEGYRLQAGFAQRPNIMLDEVRRALKLYDFEFTEQPQADGKLVRLLVNQRQDVLRLLGQARPHRLLEKFRPDMLGRMRASSYANLVEKRRLGEQWVVALNTDTGTYIAEGLASHNCADPVKIDELRANAERIYAGFPGSEAALTALGYPDTHLLHTPITEAAGVGRWTDSIFNSCVPLNQHYHIGFAASGFIGEHNDPKPITDIQHFKVDSFQFLVNDPGGGHAAVVPVAPPGSGNAQVEVVHTSADHPLHAQRLAAHAAGKRLILSADDPIAKAAFAQQTPQPAA